MLWDLQTQNRAVALVVDNMSNCIIQFYPKKTIHIYYCITWFFMILKIRGRLNVQNISELKKKRKQHICNINVILWNGESELLLRISLWFTAELTSPCSMGLLIIWQTQFVTGNSVLCDSRCLSFRFIVPAESIYWRRIFHSDTNSHLAVNNHILIKSILFIANLLPEAWKNIPTRSPFILFCNHFPVALAAIWGKWIPYQFIHKAFSWKF